MVNAEAVERIVSRDNTNTTVEHEDLDDRSANSGDESSEKTDSEPVKDADPGNDCPSSSASGSPSDSSSDVGNENEEYDEDEEDEDEDDDDKDDDEEDEHEDEDEEDDEDDPQTTTHWAPHMMQAPIVSNLIADSVQLLFTLPDQQRIYVLRQLLRIPTYQLPLRIAHMQNEQEVAESLTSAYYRCRSILWATRGTSLVVDVQFVLSRQGDRVWDMFEEWQDLALNPCPYWQIIPFGGHATRPPTAYLWFAGGLIVPNQSMFNEPITLQSIGPLYWNHRNNAAFLLDWVIEFWRLGRSFQVW